MLNVQRMNVFLQGLMWGVLLGIIDLSLSSISTSTHLSIISQLIWVIDIAAYLYVGLTASWVTGKTGMGALVGLLTGLFSALVSSVVTITNTITHVDALRQAAQSMADQQHLNIHYTNNAVILSTLFGIGVTLLLALILGSVFGAIGGAIAKNQASNTRVPEYTQDTHELIER